MNFWVVIPRIIIYISSIPFSHSVVPYFLQPHELQHSRLPCPSPTPGACSNSCPLSQWCHPINSTSVIPFSCLQSFPASGSFPMSQFFASGGQSIRASALASPLPMNIQDWFPLGLTGLISLQSKGLSRVFSNTSSKASVLWCSAFFWVQLSLSLYIYMYTYIYFSIYILAVWNLSCYTQDLFNFSLWLLVVTRGILVPWPGIEPGLPALEAWSLNHWTTREVPQRS